MGYLKKLMRYIKKVYHIDDMINVLTDNRINPTYSTTEVILPVFFGFILRIPSFIELKYRLINDDFGNIIASNMKTPRLI